MRFNKILAAIVTAGALAPALAAATYDFQTVAGPDLGSSFPCTGGIDQCSSMAPAFGGAMTFYGGAVSATGYFDSANGFTLATSVLDNFGNRPSADLKWVGLGVYSQLTAGGAFVNSDDNITNDEALVLKFGSTIQLTDVTLRAEGHFDAFAKNTTFGVSTSLGGAVTTFAFTPGNNLYNIASVGPSDTYVFHFGAPSGEQYYVSSVTAVPEPGTYALMAAGLLAVGFINARRRKAD